MARSMRRSNEAVSAVLGVLLIIIIMIALGGAVWVMVDKIRQTHPVNEHAIQITFRLNAGSPKTLSVIKANPPNLDWVNDVRVSGTCTPKLNGATFPTVAGTPIQAGDTLSGCTSGQTLSIAGSPTHGGDLLFSATF